MKRRTSPIDKYDTYSKPLSEHELRVKKVKDYYDKAVQDRLNRFGSDAITNSQEEKES